MPRTSGGPCLARVATKICCSSDRIIYVGNARIERETTGFSASKDKRINLRYKQVFVKNISQLSNHDECAPTTDSGCNRSCQLGLGSTSVSSTELNDWSFAAVLASSGVSASGESAPPAWWLNTAIGGAGLLG
jgi:hypothetical protein